MVLEEKLTPSQLEKLKSAQPPTLATKATNRLLLDLLKSVKKTNPKTMRREVGFAEGSFIFHQGDSADNCYLILEGRVGVLIGDIESPAAVMHRGVGDIIGEMALLDEKPRSASIVALSDVRLERIDREEFDSLIAINPTLTKQLLSMLSFRLRNAHQLNAANVEKRALLNSELSLLAEENELLQEVQRARQEMVDLIVHDLRNPLANLFGTMKLLEQQLPRPFLDENEDLMSIMNLAYLRLDRLVESLTDLRGIENGTRELELTAVNLHHLIEQSLELAAFIIKKRQIEVRINFPNVPPIILADENMINRVLTILIDHALKHLSEQGILTIQVRALEDFWQIEVMDNGVAVSTADYNRLFVPYSQNMADLYHGRGYGFGLLFVSQAVEAHNGRIWVELGEGGQGSKFVFTLPA